MSAGQPDPDPRREPRGSTAPPNDPSAQAGYRSGDGQADGGSGGARATHDDRSLGELLTDLGDEVSTLFRQEVELAKAEVTRDVTRFGRASGLMVAGAVLAFVALLLVAWTVAWAFALAMPVWAGFLVTAVIVGVISGGLIVVGRNRIQQISPKPTTTIETLQEDRQWINDRMSS